MKPAFFHDAEVKRRLERAHRASGVPVSVHYVERNEEGPRVAGWGGCDACRKVSGTPGGTRACRLSRTTAASMALRQGRPLVFICHMGFACVVVPAVPGQRFALTFGPYCAEEEDRGLEHAVLSGFEALTGARPPEPPVSLEDIHRAKPDSVPAVAQWAMESLADYWKEFTAPLQTGPESGGEPPETAAGGQTPPGKRKKRTPVRAAPAADVALALAGGNRRQARRLLSGMLEEARLGSRASEAERRAWAVATAAEVLHACTRAGMAAGPGWEAFAGLAEGLREGTADRELLKAMMDVLRKVRAAGGAGAPASAAPPVRQTPAPKRRAAYHALNRIVEGRLVEGVPISEAAAALGISPSALSKRLDKNFGMNYSEYVNRLRIKRAKELLRRTRCTAGDAARRVGIGDQSYFSKLFRRFEGMTPTEYRARFRRKK